MAMERERGREREREGGRERDCEGRRGENMQSRRLKTGLKSVQRFFSFFIFSKRPSFSVAHVGGGFGEPAPLPPCREVSFGSWTSLLFPRLVGHGGCFFPRRAEGSHLNCSFSASFCGGIVTAVFFHLFFPPSSSSSAHQHHPV